MINPNKWLEHDGTRMPIPLDSTVTIKLRNKLEYNTNAKPWDGWIWKDLPCDVMCYSLAAKFKVIK